MTSDRALIDAAADALCSARAARCATGALPDMANADTAYAVQAAVADRLGGIAGWKAAIFPDGQIFCAPLPGATVLTTPASRPETCLPRAGVEAEVAFRLARAIPAAGPPLDPLQQRAAIAAAHAAIEVVDSRLADWRAATPLAIVADNLLGSALIIGDALGDWERMDLAAPGFALHVDGVCIAAPGRNAADPFALFGHVLTHCRAQGIDLAPGTWITTGTTTGLVFVDNDKRVELLHAGRCLAAAGPAKAPYNNG